MRACRLLFVAAATAVAAKLLVWGARRFGARSATFAFLVVWAPMAWLGTVSRIVQPRLPRSYHELRDVERDGALYEMLGVKVFKRLLRRGPLAVFNPELHLPAERSPERLARLDQKMRDAEASHGILLVATFGVAVHAAVRGWWTSAGLIVLFDVLMNGYPVMLQRYNRALLLTRFPGVRDSPGSGSADGLRRQDLGGQPAGGPQHRAPEGPKGPGGGDCIRTPSAAELRSCENAAERAKEGP